MNTQLPERQKLIQLIGESVLDSLSKAGVHVEIPSGLEKSSSSSNNQNVLEQDLLYQRIFEHRLTLINELSKMYRDEPRRRNH